MIVDASPFWQPSADSTLPQQAVHQTAQRAFLDSLNALGRTLQSADNALAKADDTVRKRLRTVDAAAALFAPGSDQLAEPSLPDRRSTLPFWQDSRWLTERDPFFEVLAEIEAHDTARRESEPAVRGAANRVQAALRRVEALSANPFAQPALLNADITSVAATHPLVAAVVQDRTAALPLHSTLYEPQQTDLFSSARWWAKVNATGSDDASLLTQ